RGRGKHGLPERVADDGDCFATALIILRGDPPAKFGRSLERLEEVAVDSRGADSLGRTTLCEIEHRLLERSHVLEGVVLTLDVVEISIGGTEVLRREIEAWIGGIKIDEPVRIAVR